MKHFPLESWADFARGVTPPAEARAMQRHLDEVCKDCSRALDSWRALLDFAGHEPSYEPPESAVRLVNQYFALHGPQPEPSIVVKAARLVFDSWQQPALEGVRSSARSMRQLLYEFDRFAIDVRTETEPASARICLVGQVLDREEPRKTVSEVPVALLRGEKEVLSTVTNQYGEFYLTLEAAEDLLDAGQDLRLLVQVEPGTRLALELAGI